MTNLTPLQKEINSIYLAARNFQITSPEDFQNGSDFLSQCNQRIKKVKETFKEIKEKTHAAWKQAVASEHQHLNPVEEAKQIVGGKMSEYKRKLDAIEAQKRADAAKKAREEEEAKRKAEAAELKEQGYEEEAKAVESEPRPVTMTVPAKTDTGPKPKGLSFRDNWKIEVVDLNKLIAEAPQYVIADKKALDAVARSQKERCKIPGCRTWCEQVPIQK